MKSLLFTSMGLVALLLASPAEASKTYPKELLDYYGIEALPAPDDGCTLCHSTEEGGPKTVVTPYGRALMVSFNAAGADVPSLLGALREAETAGWDSDQDGITDADELRSGMDPNSYDGTGEPPPQIDVPLPQTGCGFAARTPGNRTGTSVSLLLAGVVLFVRRRRPHAVESSPRRRRSA